jgi:hypothetical protein
MGLPPFGANYEAPHFFELGRWGSPVETGVEGHSERHMVRDFRLMSAGIRRGDESCGFLSEHF